MVLGFRFGDFSGGYPVGSCHEPVACAKTVL